MEEVRPAQPRRTRHIVVIGALVAILTIVVTVLLWPGVNPTKTNSPIPASVKSQLKFSAYYPIETADGWQIDRQSFRTDQGVLLYVVKGPAGDISITQQTKPADFDFEKFHHQVLTDGTLILTPLGDGAIGKADNKLIGSLIIGKTWVLATPTSSSISQNQLVQLLDSLKKD